MWTFIPLLPTKAAWENRLFNTAYSLKDILRQLHDKDLEWQKRYNGGRLVLPGQLILKPPPLKEGEPEPPAYRLSGPSHLFSGIRDLERILKEEKIEESQIQQIHFYQTGWWRTG